MRNFLIVLAFLVIANVTLGASLSERSEVKAEHGESKEKFFGGPFLGPRFGGFGPWGGFRRFGGLGFGRFGRFGPFGGFPHPAYGFGGFPHPGLGYGPFLKDAHKNNLAARSEVKATKDNSQEKFFGGPFGGPGFGPFPHPALAFGGFPHPALPFGGLPPPALGLGGFAHPGLGFLKDAEKKDAK